MNKYVYSYIFLYFFIVYRITMDNIAEFFQNEYVILGAVIIVFLIIIISMNYESFSAFSLTGVSPTSVYKTNSEQQIVTVTGVDNCDELPVDDTIETTPPMKEQYVPGNVEANFYSPQPFDSVVGYPLQPSED